MAESRHMHISFIVPAGFVIGNAPAKLPQQSIERAMPRGCSEVLECTTLFYTRGLEGVGRCVCAAQAQGGSRLLAKIDHQQLCQDI